MKYPVLNIVVRRRDFAIILRLFLYKHIKGRVSL